MTFVFVLLGERNCSSFPLLLYLYFIFPSNSSTMLNHLWFSCLDSYKIRGR
nr:MAG TPA: hypothetical protein [Caudoviricetes sp.]